MPPSGNLPGGAKLTGPTNHRRPDKAFMPPSGNLPGGAALTGPTNHRRPDGASDCLMAACELTPL
ncbi:hypothetical protein EGX86_02130 [Citrobacter koseri]|nr:hypothetical protein EGX86_02130 [Citrobacter koseri]